MMNLIFDVDQNRLIEVLAERLKEEKLVSPPSWSSFVKTGAHKERPPLREDWWFVRSAAVLRSVFLLGPVGTEKLRRKFGGRKNRGVKPERFVKGSGSVTRKILQQLEQAGLVVQGVKGVHKGRVVTGKGVKLLRDAALRVKGD